MAIQFACECGKQLQAKEEHAGRLTRCPGCGREMTIPDGAVQAVSAPRASRPPEQYADRPMAAPGGRERTEDDRSPRREAPRTSWKAITSLVLGLLSPCLGVVSLVLAGVFGILTLVEVSRSRGRVKGSGLAVTGMVFSLLGTALQIGGIVYGYQRMDEARNRARAQNNLKQISLAMLNYESVNRSFPPPAGGPGQKHPVSWRVQILPFVEQEYAFTQYNMNEPWDGPNNIRLLERMPKIYQVPGTDKKTKPGHTYYQVFVGGGAAFENGRGMRFGDFSDGASNTIMVVEAAEAVPWTKPDDLPYSPSAPLPKLGGHFRGGFQAAYADGSVRFIPDSISEKTLRALITRAGAEPLGGDAP